MLNSIIIGPSGVGKTALVASLQHACNIVSAQDSRHRIHAIPKNSRTRGLFTQALDIIEKGELPFAGTELSICYDFILNMEEKESGLWSKVKSSLGWGKYKGSFQFMDAPGGAVFDNELHARHAENPNFQSLIGQMLSSKGLVICVDMTHALLKKNECAHLHRYYMQSLQFFFTHGFQITVPFRRVCFVFTKSDLYAKKKGVKVPLNLYLEKQDHFSLIRNVIGDKSIETLVTFLDDDAKVCFSATSVFGFYEGASLLSWKEKGEAFQIEQWCPYNVAESFSFLLTGEKHHKAQSVCTVAQLRTKIKR